jgi:hypothetical protein
LNGTHVTTAARFTDNVYGRYIGTPSQTGGKRLLQGAPSTIRNCGRRRGVLRYSVFLLLPLSQSYIRAAAVLVDEFDDGLCRSEIGLRTISASEKRQLSQGVCTREVSFAALARLID